MQKKNKRVFTVWNEFSLDWLCVARLTRLWLLSAIVYRLPISLQEIEIYRSPLSPMAFLKLSIIVIASVQKGLSLKISDPH